MAAIRPIALPLLSCLLDTSVSGEARWWATSINIIIIVRRKRRQRPALTQLKPSTSRPTDGRRAARAKRVQEAPPPGTCLRGEDSAISPAPRAWGITQRALWPCVTNKPRLTKARPVGAALGSERGRNRPLMSEIIQGKPAWHAGASAQRWCSAEKTTLVLFRVEPGWQRLRACEHWRVKKTMEQQDISPYLVSGSVDSVDEPGGRRRKEAEQLRVERLSLAVSYPPLQTPRRQRVCVGCGFHRCGSHQAAPTSWNATFVVQHPLEGPLFTALDVSVILTAWLVCCRFARHSNIFLVIELM